MAKNRVRLNISGVSCMLITEEDESYVREMAAEVEALIDSMTKAGSNFSVATVITALSFLDENKKNSRLAEELKNKLTESEAGLRAAEAENKKLSSEKENLEAKIKKLEAEVKKLSSAPAEPKPKARQAVGELKNPFRPQIDETGLVSFYERISFFDEK